MADGPKSFWSDTDELSPNARTSDLDGTPLRPEADILYITARAGVSFADLQGMELWEAAAAAGLHLGETIAEKDQRDIIDTKQAEWAETADARTRKLREAAERRKARKQKPGMVVR